MNNPYKPSNAALKDSPAQPRSATLSVIVGLVVDIGGTTVWGIVVGIAYAVMLASQGKQPEQIQAALAQADPGSGYFILSTAVGIGFSALGGYVCARMVQRNEFRVTGILALLTALGGILMSRASALEPWLLVFLNLATFAAVLLGGELGRRRNRATASDASAASAA